MAIDFTIRGIDQVNRNLQLIDGQILDAVAKALEAEGEIEMTKAKRRTPVKTDVLRASGHVLPVQRKGREMTVTLAFGGPAIGYAVYVHENLEAFHKVGQAKFLESTIRESAPYLAARVAARVKRGGG